ncbi:MAG: hypothetical protein DCF25_04915 [Leptolyngbya foveolarum]|uniref:Circadian input-output histidine kinase CikA n=1 Tax=Leptolyngbya foveolarum TaxID=47253 RepID=A0A2W4ULF4_9CYAN|nr:MAG: hypothetical protein DCF25_04915 [Leptolyngbya foveolarum]
MPDALPQTPITPVPANETERLRALHRYRVLDTSPEEAFDRITKLAARLFDMPTALISLVDESRAWFKSSVGFDAGEVSRDATLCSFAVLTDEPLIVLDARLDDRFACNPFVQSEPGVRFYAGAPLITEDGFNLGTLCLLDGRPRDPLSADQQATLVDLAAMVVDELDLRLAAHKITQADAALQETNVQLDTALTAGSTYVWRWHIPTDRVIVSTAFARLFDVDPVSANTEGLPIKFFIDSMHEEDRDRVSAAIQQAIETGEAYAAEYRVCTATGEERWLTARGRAEYDEAGRPTAFPGALADITERKRAEEDRDRFFQISHDMLAIANRDGYFTQVNPAFTETLGYTSQELTAQPYIEFVHPDDQAKTMAEAEIIAQGNPTVEFENRYRAQDGTYRWISWNVVPFAKQELLYCVARDVTDRKQTEAKLQSSNDRLKLLSTTANDLLLNENPRAFLANLFAQVSTYLGLEVYFNYLFDEDQQCLRLHAHGGISDEISESANVLGLGQGVCGCALQQRHPIVVEAALDSDDPLALPLKSVGIRAYASHPLIVGDHVLGTLGLGTRQRDRFTPDELHIMQVIADQVAVSLERSRLVLALETRAEALVQTNRIKDEFLAVLSHELRSPLNPILGWVSLLQKGKLNPAQQTKALETIERNAKLQAQLIEDLLDISRIMQGKLTLTAAPVSLAFVISSALETVQLAAAAKNIQISLDLDTTVAPVSGDATRLQQVVWNLLTNAVKFTPAGGRVTVELRQLDQSAEIRVRDTGKGIDSKFLAYVFEYFRQADSTTTRRFGGLGLGLAIVQQIVEMHGGTIKVESLGEDQGATFTVQLPIARQAVLAIAAPTAAKAETTNSVLSNLKILVVDDDLDAREFQSFLLEQSGATVMAVASGSAALQVLDQSMPDILVSDIGMAEMDGCMLIQQIRARPSHRGGVLRAIAVTAYARDLDRQRALQSGFQKCITKPVEPEVLIASIVDLLGGS